MRQDLHLFIGDKEVEFNADPKILFNYKLTELENPTVVKNSWTKSIEIPQTPANDDIFGHYWNLERAQFDSAFNAMIKVPFQLYINGDLIEKGYAKLDSIKSDNHKGSYSVQLFGGLGSFFYSLTYDQSSDGNNKKNLASLVYTSNTVSKDPELNFVINKETISSAWTQMMGNAVYDDKWNVVNFAPVYNGKPDDFDSDKVLINHRGAVGVQHAMYVPEAGENYYPVLAGALNQSGFSMGTFSEEMTSDEVFDLRSYLQRPVVSVNRVLQACFQPENNGGWQVVLDSHFFHNDNPYWTNGWLTLPLLRDLEIKGGDTETITSASFSKVNKNRYNLSYGSTLSTMNNVRMKVNVQFTLNNGQSTTATTLYSAHHSDISGWGVLEGYKYVDHYDENDGVVVQLIGRDANGTICAASKAYLLSSKRNQAYYGGPLWEGFWKSGNGYPEPREYVWMEGKWRKSGNKYYFADMAGNRKDIEFNFEANSEIASIEIRTMMNGSEYIDYKLSGKSAANTPDQTFVCMWPTMSSTGSGHQTIGTVVADRVLGSFSFVVDEFYGIATDYQALFSGSYIPKDKLLSTSYSPADFLLSYAKLFGLYFYVDPTEVSGDPDRCPNGVVHIYDRDTFFTDEYVDIQDRIDRSKTITVTPTLAGSKWYSFKQNETDGDAAEAYMATYGYEYGRQLVNTGYNFDSNTTDLYKGTVYNNGVMVREKDKYFSYPTGGRPVWLFNGFTYSLYHYNEDLELEDLELEVGRKALPSVAINTLGLPNYDVMSKLQCHGKDNEATDGDGILLFYRGPVQTNTAGGLLNYWITDDVQEMALLNGGAPCWLWTNNELDGLGNKIAIKTNHLPHFTRDLTLYGLQEGNIVHSWNFGHPQVTFVPDVFTSDGDCLYDKCWASYIRDLYSVDGRKITCFVKMLGKPGPGILRKWYWFDNSVWRLNEVKDWNALDYGTVQCEFVKVQDVNNYKLNKIMSSGNQSLELYGDFAPYSGGTVNGAVIMQSGGNWHTENNNGTIHGIDAYGNRYTVTNAIRPNTGHGASTSIQVVFPASSAQTPITWTVVVYDSNDNAMAGTIIQAGDQTPFLDFAAASKNVTATTQAQTVLLNYIFQNVDPDTIVASSNSTDWCTVSSVDHQSKTVTLAITEARLENMRGAQITISGMGVDGVTSVTAQTILNQNGTRFEAYPTELTFHYNSTSGGAITIISSQDWTASIQDGE